MTLTYRGQTYTTSNTTAEATQSIFTYRGQSYQHSPSEIAVIPSSKLVYRGVPYTGKELNSIPVLLDWGLI
jgi:hypothetical protein